MTMRRRAAAVVLCTGLTLASMAAARSNLAVSAQSTTSTPAPGESLVFVGCPLVRDTSTVPCWLAEHEGDLYYLGSQGSTSSAFYPPQLLHDVLVEATVGDGPRICGGRPLVNVEVSVLRELNRACNTILPAEPQYTAPPSPPAPIPAFADDTHEFRVPYDFDSDYLTLHTTRILHEVVRVAKLVNPKRVEVQGVRTSVRLSDGRTLVERESLARERAEAAAKILRGLGVDASRVHASWRDDIDSPGDRTDRERRVTVIRLLAR